MTHKKMLWRELTLDSPLCSLYFLTFFFALSKIKGISIPVCVVLSWFFEHWAVQLTCKWTTTWRTTTWWKSLSYYPIISWYPGIYLNSNGGWGIGEQIIRISIKQMLRTCIGVLSLWLDFFIFIRYWYNVDHYYLQ